MLSKGYLAGTIFYASTAHSDEIMNSYLSDLDEVFFNIAECEKKNLNINELLKVPESHTGFKRLN